MIRILNYQFAKPSATFPTLLFKKKTANNSGLD